MGWSRFGDVFIAYFLWTVYVGGLWIVFFAWNKMGLYLVLAAGLIALGREILHLDRL